MADSLMSLTIQRAEARTAEGASLLQRQAEAVDRQIDRLVYGLYALSDDEIAVIEGAFDER